MLIETVRMLNDLRRGERTAEMIAMIRSCDRAIVSNDGIEPIKLTSTTDNCDTVNNDRLQSLSGDVNPFKSTDTGNTQLLKDRCIAPSSLDLKIGYVSVCVMCCVNIGND